MATDGSSTLLSEYDRLADDFRRLGGYDSDRGAQPRRQRPGHTHGAPAAGIRPAFRWGKRPRVNLARLILEVTDILLLDEPTNHLDMRATEWLEDYVLHFNGTVLAISHDRYFLDVVAQRCVEIRRKAELYSGNYSFYTVGGSAALRRSSKYEKDQAKIAQLEAAAAKLHLWAFMGNDKLHKRAFSMEKRIEKLSQTEKPKMKSACTRPSREREFRGDEALATDGLTRATRDYGSSTTSAWRSRAARIAVIGENGSGRTTREAHRLARRSRIPAGSGEVLR